MGKLKTWFLRKQTVGAWIRLYKNGVPVRGRITDLEVLHTEATMLEVALPPHYNATHIVANGSFHWNKVRQAYEMDLTDVDEGRGREAYSPVESWDNRPRDREETEPEADHDQGPQGTFRSARQKDGGLVGESQGRVRAGYDADTASESPARRPDDPGTDQSVSHTRHKGTVNHTIAVNNAVPEHVLVMVKPDLSIHIGNPLSYVGGLPDGTIIWVNQATADRIRGGKSLTSLH